MKINILFDFIDGPFGGGNQFLKALKNELINSGTYEENIDKADVIIFNSFHKYREVINAKHKYKDKFFIHRVDGPTRLYNSKFDLRDNINDLINLMIADGTIFQSEWSKCKNINSGMKKIGYNTVILNAPDPKIFYKNINNKCIFQQSEKVRLIASSWSHNINKGFEVYKWLDNNLNFNQYEMSFVGVSPVKFKNIKIIEPVESKILSDILKRHHIFITASKNDPCSNSLIEALHSGLPVVAFNSGGHPEIVKTGGELFNSVDEIPVLLDKIINNYSLYISNINVNSIEYVAEKYINFIKLIIDRNQIKNLNNFSRIYTMGLIILYNNFMKYSSVIRKLVFR